MKWSWVGPDKLPLWVADMDFPVADAVASQLRGSIAAGDLGYPSGEEMQEVRAAYCERAKRLFGMEARPEAVELTADVVQSIYLCILAYSEPGDAVVLNTPAYPPFFTSISETKRKLVEVPLGRGPKGYFLDLDRLEAAVSRSGAKILLFCNPHNPTGRVFSSEELAGLAEIACAADLVVVSDEIHADLVYGGHSHRSVATLSEEMAARTVTLSSASKSFNMAGLRCATAAFGSKELKDRFNLFPEHARGGLSVMGMRATLAAWRHGEGWLAKVLGYLQENRDLVGSVLGGLEGVVHFAPQATYLSWIDFSGVGLGEDPSAVLAEKAGIVLSPGPSFGEPGLRHARLNFATPRPLLAEALGRLAEACAGA